MTVDTNILQYSSEWSGFKNVLPDIPFSASYAGGTLLSGGYTGPIRASAAINNTNEVSQVQVNFGGLESFYRLLPGTFFELYPSAASPQYEIEAFSYFTNGNITCDFWISNQSAGSVSVPAITFNCNASLFIAPFG